MFKTIFINPDNSLSIGNECNKNIKDIIIKEYTKLALMCIIDNNLKTEKEAFNFLIDHNKNLVKDRNFIKFFPLIFRIELTKFKIKNKNS